MTARIDGQVALVTGGSRGIGAAIALELATIGADVALVGRDTTALAASVAAIEATGRAAFPIEADLARADSAATIVEAAVRRFGRIDVLINAAGSARHGGFLKLPDAAWDEGFGLKFFGAMRLCRASWPHLAAAKGRVVNIAGVGAHTPSKDYAIGGSINAALIHFGKALADLGRADGVRVNTVNPGYVETDRVVGNLDRAAAKRGVSRDVVGAEVLATIGVRRFANAAEIGRFVAFLVSDDGAYIDGASLDIDGGWTRGV